MKCIVTDFGKDSIVFNITDSNRAELENRLNLFFTAENLQLKSDKPDEKIFQRGNKILRILFGAFIKYFRINVAIREESGLFSVRILRDMNLAMSGGLIGINKSRKEFERIGEAFKVNFNQ